MRFRENERVVAARPVHRAAGSAWPGDRLVVVKVHGNWIGDDTYDVRRPDGTLLTGVTDQDLDRANW